MNRTLASLVLVILSALFGACSTMEQRLPDGSTLRIDTVRTFDHAHSFATRWVDTGKKDTEGRPIMEELKVDKVLTVRADGTPVIVQERVGDKISGPSVVGQMATAAVGGTVPALINASAGRSIAAKNRCPAGSVCPGATVITNQVQSVAEALNENRVRIGVNAGVPACARTASNTCGD